MQSVPSEFVTQLRPLMFVAGLGSEQQQEPAPSSTSSPSAFIQLVQSLRQVLTAKRAFHTYEKPVARAGTDFHVVLVEKSVRFPPRKARLANNQVGPHSPISPFSPTSPLYPDGIMAPIWIRKHRELVPSVFVLVSRLYEFGLSNEDGTAPSKEEIDIGPLEKEKLERLRDNELVNEVLNRKRACSERGIKLAVVLLTSREMLDDPALDVRLSHIRRLSTLDSRASLFVLSPVPTTEVQNFVVSLKGELAESSIDYYREHGRRLRRKRSRPANSASNSAIISSANNEGSATEQKAPVQTLSTQALAVRYEYKTAVFAEFRGEVEVALKHYEDCYYALVDLFTQSLPSTSSSTGNLQSASSLAQQPQLQSRTKRWAEAKVLLDCVAFKISKMYLYAGNSQYAVATYRNHVQRFAKISDERWKMGNESFEYWSWASKQHRMFAELVEVATRAGYPLPALPAPTPGPPLHARAAAQHIPDTVLQHPGFYYYLAGLCAVRRRDCFKSADSPFSLPFSPENESAPKLSAALTHERTIPHSEQIIELFTKAYEYFKRHKATRVTLFLADRISDVHGETGNGEMSLKFDERIARTYRREGWAKVLDGILERSTNAAKVPKKKTKEALVEQKDEEDAGQGDEEKADEVQTPPDVKSAIRFILERTTLKGAGIHPSDAREEQLMTQLVDMLEATEATSAPKSFTIDSLQSPIVLSCISTFWRTDADLNTPIPFQIHLASSALAALQDERIVIQSMQIHWSDQRTPTSITHAAAESGGRVQLDNLAQDQDDLKGDLRFTKKDKILCGTITSSNTHTLQIAKVSVQLTIASFRITLDVHPEPAKLKAARWLAPAQSEEDNEDRYLTLPAKEGHTSCHFHPRKLAVTFDVNFPSPAYLNESLPIRLVIVNNDSVPVEITLDGLMQPFGQVAAATELTVRDTLHLDGTSEKNASLASQQLVDSLSPGGKAEKIVYFTSTGLPGTRNMDLSIVCKPAATEGSPDTEERISFTEISKQLSIDVVHPFYCDFQTTWYPTSGKTAQGSARKVGKGLLNMQEPDPWDSAVKCLLDVTAGGMGPTELEVLSLHLDLRPANDRIRLKKSSLNEGDGQLPDTWHPEDPFSVMYELEIKRSYLSTTTSPGSFEIEWRRISDNGADTPSTAKTSIPIPPFPVPAFLTSPPESSAPIVVCTCPSVVKLYEPFPASYRFLLPSLAPEDIAGSAAPRLLSFLIESASDNFVFTGPRKIERHLVLPGIPGSSNDDGELLADYTFVPVGSTGFVDLPLVRVWEVLETPAEEMERRRLLQEQGQEAQYEGPRMRELKVMRAGAEIPKEGQEQQGGGDVEKPLQVFVVPR